MLSRKSYWLPAQWVPSGATNLVVISDRRIINLRQVLHTIPPALSQPINIWSLGQCQYRGVWKSDSWGSLSTGEYENLIPGAVSVPGSMKMVVCHFALVECKSNNAPLSTFYFKILYEGLNSTDNKNEEDKRNLCSIVSLKITCRPWKSHETIPLTDST